MVMGIDYPHRLGSIDSPVLLHQSLAHPRPRKGNGSSTGRRSPFSTTCEPTARSCLAAALFPGGTASKPCATRKIFARTNRSGPSRIFPRQKLLVGAPFLVQRHACARSPSSVALFPRGSSTVFPFPSGRRRAASALADGGAESSFSRAPPASTSRLVFEFIGTGLSHDETVRSSSQRRAGSGVLHDHTTFPRGRRFPHPMKPDRRKDRRDQEFDTGRRRAGKSLAEQPSTLPRRLQRSEPRAD